ncbi:unnamed protein product, partial [Ectocarpus sp. 4 AP-2014]
MKAIRVVAHALLLLTASTAMARTWTNDKGESLEADILRIKGRTAILSSNRNKEIQAPIARLSPADQAWIERYKALTQTREWGTPGNGVRRGQFLRPRADGIDPLAAPMRDWTDVKGRVIRAAYLGTEGPNALLFLRAKEVSVPLT